MHFLKMKLLLVFITLLQLHSCIALPKYSRKKGVPSPHVYDSSGGTALVQIHLKPNVFDELAKTLKNVVVKQLTTKGFPDLGAELYVPVLKKLVQFNFSDIKVDHLSAKTATVKLEDGFAIVSISGLEAQVSANLTTSGTSQGRFHVKCSGHGQGHLIAKNDGQGTLVTSIEEPNAQFTSLKLHTPRHFLNWVIQGIQFIFQGAIKNQLGKVTKNIIRDQIPILIQPVFDEIRQVNGIAGLFFYSSYNQLEGEPKITPEGVDLSVKIQAYFTD